MSSTKPQFKLSDRQLFLLYQQKEETVKIKACDFLKFDENILSIIIKYSVCLEDINCLDWLVLLNKTTRSGRKVIARLGFWSQYYQNYFQQQVSPKQNTLRCFERDYQSLKEALSNNGQLLANLPRSVKKDPILVTLAIGQYPRAFLFADNCLQTDRQFIKKLIKISPPVSHFLPTEIKQDTEFILILFDSLFEQPKSKVLIYQDLVNLIIGCQKSSAFTRDIKKKFNVDLGLYSATVMIGFFPEILQYRQQQLEQVYTQAMAEPKNLRVG